MPSYDKIKWFYKHGIRRVLWYNYIMTEHSLQLAIIQYLETLNLYALRVNSGTVCDARTGSYIRLAKRGHPDIVCALPDKTIGFIEVKSKTGTLSTDQITTLRNIASKGLKWLVADDIDDLVKWLADPSYHGKGRHIKALNKKFAYSEVPKSKKLTSSQFWEFEMHARKKDKQ